MDDELLKLECLRTAISQGLKGQEAREEAERIFAMLKGRTIEPKGTAKARVVGSEGTFKPPYDDYMADKDK